MKNLISVLTIILVSNIASARCSLKERQAGSCGQTTTPSSSSSSDPGSSLNNDGSAQGVTLQASRAYSAIQAVQNCANAIYNDLNRIPVDQRTNAVKNALLEFFVGPNTTSWDQYSCMGISRPVDLGGYNGRIGKACSDLSWYQRLGASNDLSMVARDLDIVTVVFLKPIVHDTGISEQCANNLPVFSAPAD